MAETRAQWAARMASSITRDTGVPLEEARPLIDAILAAEEAGDPEAIRDTTAALGFAVWMAAHQEAPPCG